MKLLYYKSPENDPRTNLAIEEYLTETVQRDEIIMFLWRNAHTVVIGRNQNAWRECHVDLLLNDGGNIVRRMSGGGAVYHDLGNVNFTFAVHEDNYNIAKQTAVLIEAAASFGITAEKTGRNDLMANGRKISGNAYFQTGKNRCHHGTILVNTDFELMGKYLHTPGGKMSGRGVTSVKSRVVNLSELADVTADNMETAMQHAFEKTYNNVAATCGRPNSREINKRREKYASSEWTLGTLKDYTWETENRFDWGSIHIRLGVTEGIIKTAEIFSDALDADCIETIKQVLKGTIFTTEDMVRVITGTGTYAEDICKFLTTI